MGCFPTTKVDTKDSKSFFNQKGYPSTEMGNSGKESINPKPNQMTSKNLIICRSTRIELKYSIIKHESLEFANQYKVINTEINKTFIMTKITKASINNEAEFRNTLQLMVKFKSLHLINIIDSFEDNINYYIISEYFEDKNLFDKVSSLPSYSENLIGNITVLLLETMDELSSSQIKHTIIHPQRIYLNQDMKTQEIQIKVNALFYLEEYITYPIKDNNIILFSSPELLSSSKKENYYLVWSIGVILYCLFLGEIPFNGVTKDEVLRNIKSKAYIRVIDNASISKKAKIFLKEMLAVEHKKRLEAKLILFHPFFECLNDKETSIQTFIEESTSIKIRGLYSKMHFIKYTNSFISDYIEMRIKIIELLPLIKQLIDQKINNLVIEEIISKHIGSSINKMNLMRVKQETLDLKLNHLDLINGIVYHWYKINQKYYRKGYNQLVSFNNGAVNKSELIDLMSYSDSAVIITIQNSIKAQEKDSLLYDEFELIVIQALALGDNGEMKDAIQEIIMNKENENVFQDKWPFADSSNNMDIMILNKSDADSSVSSSDDF